MDDLLLFMPTKKSHFEKLEGLLKALCKNGLKSFPRKCQLFITELQYMGNTIFIKDGRVHVKPLRSRLEAIQNLKPPTTPKVAGVCWNGKFCEHILPRAVKLLKPIYGLTRKSRPFILGRWPTKSI